MVHFHGSELRPQSGHVVAHDLRDHFMEQRIVDAIITPQGLPRRRHLAIISSISIAIFFIISNAIAVFLITAIITIIITMSSLGCEVACAPGGEWQVLNLRIPQPPPCTLPDSFGPLGAAGRQGLSSACYCFEASYWKGTVCYEPMSINSRLQGERFDIGWCLLVPGITARFSRDSRGISNARSLSTTPGFPHDASSPCFH